MLSSYMIIFSDEARLQDAAVLVHCLAGVSRSVTVTLAYLMHARSLCLEEAFSLVRLRKPDISPNFHFLRQLLSFERQLLEMNPNRTPLSAQSGDSCYYTPDCVKCPRTGRCGCAFSATPSSSHTMSLDSMQQIHQQSGSSGTQSEGSQQHQQPQKSKCMQMQTDYLGTGIGVSPDSGIEFDRWTPADGTPKWGKLVGKSFVLPTVYDAKHQD